jgi:hypothetical protein
MSTTDPVRHRRDRGVIAGIGHGRTRVVVDLTDVTDVGSAGDRAEALALVARR